MRVLRTLISALIIPALAALAWVDVIVYSNRSMPPIAVLVAKFGAAFFFAAWFTDAFFRVKDQISNEKSFGNLETRLRAIAENLELRTRRLLATATGGESFAFISVAYLDQPVVLGTAIHHGDDPLYNVTVRVTDVDELTTDLATAFRTVLKFGDMEPNLTGGAAVWHLPERDFLNQNLFFSARNGVWLQQIVFRRIKGRWTCAYRVTRSAEQKSVELMRYIPNDFPIGEIPLDWI